MSERQKSVERQHQTSGLLTSETSKGTSKCPLGLCDGSGFIITWQEDTNGMPIEYAERCPCQNSGEQAKIRVNANIPPEYAECTVNNFDTSLYSDIEAAKKVRKAAAEFISHFQKFREQGKGLYFYSGTKGSGKTRLACSMGNAIILTQTMRVNFIKTIELLSVIKDTYNKKNAEITEKEAIDRIKKAPFLIIDDIGAERPTEWTNSIFLNILDYRISHLLVTVFTSNVPQSKLKLDERIVDRIIKMSIEIHFPEESIRQKRAATECGELLKILGI